MGKSSIKGNYKLIFGITVTSIMLLISVISIFYTPYPPEMMDVSLKFSGASFEHILGCDNFGRDIFSRIMSGIGTTMVVACGTVFIGIFFGIIIGAFTGYYGGMLDELLMRINDATLSFPSVLLALVFVSVVGTGKYKVMISLGIVFIPSFARIVRGEFLKCKNLDYVKSAKLMGASNLRIIFVHILPNTYPILLSTLAIGFNNAVLAEASMSFLGIGVQPPDSSLGRMLSEAQAFLFIKPSYAIAIGITIALLILGFVMLSEGLEKNA